MIRWLAQFLRALLHPGRMSIDWLERRDAIDDRAKLEVEGPSWKWPIDAELKRCPLIYGQVKDGTVTHDYVPKYLGEQRIAIGPVPPFPPDRKQLLCQVVDEEGRVVPLTFVARRRIHPLVPGK